MDIMEWYEQFKQHYNLIMVIGVVVVLYGWLAFLRQVYDRLAEIARNTDRIALILWDIRQQGEPVDNWEGRKP